jgi:hypothetical protein
MNRSAAHDPRPDAEWLAAELQAQADGHEADRARIEAGFDRLTATAPRRAARRRVGGPLRVRLLGVPLGALAAVATATIAVGVTLGVSDRTPHRASQAAASPSPSQAAVTAGTRPPSTPTPTPTTFHPAGTTSPRGESAPPVSAGPLTAAAAVDLYSNEYWAQEDLTLTTTTALHALHLVATISGGGTVQSTGWWSTIPKDELDVTVSHDSAGLVYDITLNPGQTLQPTVYRFGLQFNHPAVGHSFALDAYTVTAITVADAQQSSVRGTFGG